MSTKNKLYHKVNSVHFYTTLQAIKITLQAIKILPISLKKKMKNKINNKNKMNKNKTRFFEGYTIAIEQTLPILIISYRKQRTEKKNSSNEWKKIQLHFLSKKLIHSCQRKRRVDMVIDIPFQYPWYLRSSSIIFAIKLSNRKSNEPRSYIIVSSFTFIERDKMSEWNLSYI